MPALIPAWTAASWCWLHGHKIVRIENQKRGLARRQSSSEPWLVGCSSWEVSGRLAGQALRTKTRDLETKDKVYHNITNEEKGSLLEGGCPCRKHQLQGYCSGLILVMLSTRRWHVYSKKQWTELTWIEGQVRRVVSTMWRQTAPEDSGTCSQNGGSNVTAILSRGFLGVTLNALWKRLLKLLAGTLLEILESFKESWILDMIDFCWITSEYDVQNLHRHL